MYRLTQWHVTFWYTHTLNAIQIRLNVLLPLYGKAVKTSLVKLCETHSRLLSWSLYCAKAHDIFCLLSHCSLTLSDLFFLSLCSPLASPASGDHPSKLDFHEVTCHILHICMGPFDIYLFFGFNIMIPSLLQWKTDLASFSIWILLIPLGLGIWVSLYVHMLVYLWLFFTH